MAFRLQHGARTEPRKSSIVIRKSLALTFRLYCMAWKIFNIGKANEEITRLETNIANLNKRIAELEAEQKAAADNDSDVAKVAAEATTQLDAATARIIALEKERDQLKLDVKAAEESADKKAATKALEITGAQGQVPITQSGNAGQADGTNLIEQYNKITDPREKTVFYRKHKEAYDKQWAAAQNK
jgi:chromosome segregation ATPase